MEPVVLGKLSHGIRELLIKKEGDRLDTLIHFEYDTMKPGVLFKISPELKCMGFDFQSFNHSHGFGLNYVLTGSQEDVHAEINCDTLDGTNVIYKNYTIGSNKANTSSYANYVYTNSTLALTAENISKKSRYHFFETCFMEQLKKVDSWNSEIYFETFVTDKGVAKRTKYTLHLGLFD